MLYKSIALPVELRRRRKSIITEFINPGQSFGASSTNQLITISPFITYRQMRPLIAGFSYRFAYTIAMPASPFLL